MRSLHPPRPHRRRRFRNLALLLCILCLGTSGCARTYAITTVTGGTILCKGRPKLSAGYYTYRDAEGREQRINELRVREIAVQ